MVQAPPPLRVRRVCSKLAQECISGEPLFLAGYTPMEAEHTLKGAVRM